MNGFDLVQWESASQKMDEEVERLVFEPWFKWAGSKEVQHLLDYFGVACHRDDKEVYAVREVPSGDTYLWVDGRKVGKVLSMDFDCGGDVPFLNYMPPFLDLTQPIEIKTKVTGNFHQLDVMAAKRLSGAELLELAKEKLLQEEHART